MLKKDIAKMKSSAIASASAFPPFCPLFPAFPSLAACAFRLPLIFAFTFAPQDVSLHVFYDHLFFR